MQHFVDCIAQNLTNCMGQLLIIVGFKFLTPSIVDIDDVLASSISTIRGRQVNMIYVFNCVWIFRGMHY